MKSIRVRGLASLTKGLMVGFLSLLLSNLAFPAGPGWFNNFEQAVQTARQQGRPIFLDFSTSWCSVCKQMDRTTLADPAVIGRLDNFIKVKVDADVRPDLANAYGVEAYPTFIHLDANGRVVEKREGFMRVQEMTTALDRTMQSVSTSMAVAQANRQQNAGQQVQSASQQASTVASADLKLLPVEETRDEESSERESARESDGGAVAVAYDRNDPALGDSVYAMGAGPNTSRRSRFGGASPNSELRQLAEATAQPGNLESEDKPSDEKEVESKKVELAKAEEEAAKEEADKARELAAKKESEEAAKKQVAEARAREEADKAATAKPEIKMVSVASSPIIESRLAGLSEEELPKPLLSRSSSGATQAMKPAETVSRGSEKDPLATIRRIQGDKPAADSASESKSVPVVAEKKQEEKAPAVAKADSKSSEKADTEEKEPSREIASAAAPKASISSSKSDEEQGSDKNDDAKETAKTSEGATRSDIERWMKDADEKLVSERKKEARAMYGKVVEKDPDNKFGKSDMAYVKMVSLIVDRDSDILRREAYTKIKQFEARYPESDHKDYYTLIRAILAADLGETNEAHKLLGTYADRFPDSKYRKIAHDTWKDLPPVKKENKSSADSGSRSRSKSNDG